MDPDRYIPLSQPEQGLKELSTEQLRVLSANLAD